MASFDRPHEAGIEQSGTPDGAALLAGLAGMLCDQGFTIGVEGERLQVSDGPDSRGVELECRRRAGDGDQWWFTWAGGIWLCQADRPHEATAVVKSALRRVGT